MSLPPRAKIVNMATGVWAKNPPSPKNPDGITSPIFWDNRSAGAIEQWYIRPSGGAYEIVNVATGGKAVNRGGEIVCTSNNAESMIWLIQPVGGGWFTIQVPNQKIGWGLRDNKVFLASVDPNSPLQRFRFM